MLQCVIKAEIACVPFSPPSALTQPSEFLLSNAWLHVEIEWRKRLINRRSWVWGETWYVRVISTFYHNLGCCWTNSFRPLSNWSHVKFIRGSTANFTATRNIFLWVQLQLRSRKLVTDLTISTFAWTPNPLVDAKKKVYDNQTCKHFNKTVFHVDDDDILTWLHLRFHVASSCLWGCGTTASRRCWRLFDLATRREVFRGCRMTWRETFIERGGSSRGKVFVLQLQTEQSQTATKANIWDFTVSTGSFLARFAIQSRCKVW